MDLEQIIKTLEQKECLTGKDAPSRSMMSQIYFGILPTG